MEEKSPKVITERISPELERIAAESRYTPSGLWTPGVRLVDIMRWFDTCLLPPSVEHPCEILTYGMSDHSDEQPCLVKYPVAQLDRYSSYYVVPIVPHLPYNTYVYYNIGFHRDYCDIDSSMPYVILLDGIHSGPTTSPDQALLLDSDHLIAHHILALEDIEAGRINHLNIMCVAWVRRAATSDWDFLPTGIEFIGINT